MDSLLVDPPMARDRHRAPPDHPHRVAALTGEIARRIGQPPAYVRRLTLAARLHDIGKLAIPDGVLGKPGPLDADERHLIERHCRIGHALLDHPSHALLRLAATIALTHHERFDGSGYPRGLAGDAIPLAGRIVAVADVADALLHDRIYRPRWPREAVIAHLHAGAGSAYDPTVVRAALEAIIP